MKTKEEQNAYFEKLYTGMVSSKSVLYFSDEAAFKAFEDWINLPENESKYYGFLKASREGRIQHSIKR